MKNPTMEKYEAISKATSSRRGFVVEEIKKYFGEKKIKLIDFARVLDKFFRLNIETDLISASINFDYTCIEIDSDYPNESIPSSIPSSDVIVALGVLDYLDDPGNFIRNLGFKMKRGRTKLIFLSYMFKPDKGLGATNMSLEGFRELLKEFNFKESPVMGKNIVFKLIK